MAGLVPPARPKPLRRGEGPGIHAFPASPAARRGCPAQEPVLGPAKPDPSAGHDVWLGLYLRSYVIS
ncbi:hypothetical protein D4Q52_10285 [Rhodopseudomonas palustris]|uniref:Uncharacterized protein n=1 Tax=Rhodopseudomonas palustris TaxID=1076 RepID=A0A418VG06_RHOPL|nr:hypothetical protein D4Q52_10285 [Rhodopseudomonas palustris]